MSDNRLNFRIEAVSEDKAKIEMIHALRITTLKSTHNQINDNHNMWFNQQENKFQSYTNKDPDLIDFFKSEKNAYKDIRQRHYNSYKQTKKSQGKNEYLNKDKKSLAMGIFSFPPLIDELLSKDLESDLMATAKKCLENFASEFNCNIRYITFHQDEAGNSHFQWMVENFDKDTGLQLNIQTKKENGEKCQDIIFKHFKKYGFDRGRSKDLTKRIHLTTEQYKELKDAENLVGDLKIKAQNLTNENESLIEDKGHLLNEVEKLRKEKIELEQMFKNAEQYQEDIKEEITFIINAFTDAGLTYKGKSKLSIEKLAGKYLNFNDLKKLKVLLDKLEALTEKKINKRNEIK